LSVGQVNHNDGADHVAEELTKYQHGSNSCSAVTCVVLVLVVVAMKSILAGFIES